MSKKTVNIYASTHHKNTYKLVKAISDKHNVDIYQLETNGYELNINAIKKQFEYNKPDLVVICHVSNVCGIIQNYKPIFEEARKHNGITVLDMAQSCGMIKTNLQKNNVDVAIFAGHKTLYGFAGIGGAIIRKGLKINDIIQGGTGIESASEYMPKELPARLEPGTQNRLGIFSLYHSTNYLLKIGKDKIERIEREQYNKLKSILNKSKVLQPIDIENATTIISCKPTKYQPDNYEEFFNKRNIAVRIGLQCSPIAHKTLGTYPAGTIRFSVGLFTKAREFKALQCAIQQLNSDIK